MDLRAAVLSILTMVLCCATAWAETDNAAPRSGTTGVSSGVAMKANTLTYQWLPDRFRLSTTGDRDAALRSPIRTRADAGRELDTVDYRDHAALLTRLRELDGLRLVTFWDTPDFSVFFGVSRDGVAGLNLSQKKDRSKPSRSESRPRTESRPKPEYLAATIYRQ